MGGKEGCFPTSYYNWFQKKILGLDIRAIELRTQHKSCPLWTEVKQGVSRHGTPSTKDKKQAQGNSTSTSSKLLCCRNTIKKTKGKSTTREKIFENPIRNKGLLPRTFTYLQLSNRRQSFPKGLKSEVISPELINQSPVSIWKDSQQTLGTGTLKLQ